MINFDEYKDKLEKVSDGMFRSTNKYINLDKKVIKQVYNVISKDYCDTISLVDTFFIENNTLYMIEFKNSPFENINKLKILKKAVESFSFIKKYLKKEYKKIIFIVVFDRYKREYKKVGGRINCKSSPIHFNLCRYNKVFFDEIYTLDRIYFKKCFNFTKDWN